MLIVAVYVYIRTMYEMRANSIKLHKARKEFLKNQEIELDDYA